MAQYIIVLFLHLFFESLRYKTLVEHLNASEFCRDLDVANLLTFPPCTDLHAHPLVVQGSLLLQDKVRIPNGGTGGAY